MADFRVIDSSCIRETWGHEHASIGAYNEERAATANFGL